MMGFDPENGPVDPRFLLSATFAHHTHYNPVQKRRTPIMKSTLRKNVFNTLSLLLFAFAVGVAPACSSTEEDEASQQDEFIDEMQGGDIT
jgi:hypothetical protein